MRLYPTYEDARIIQLYSDEVTVMIMFAGCYALLKVTDYFRLKRLFGKVGSPVK